MEWFQKKLVHKLSQARIWVCRNWQRIKKGKRKAGIKNGQRWEAALSCRVLEATSVGILVSDFIGPSSFFPPWFCALISTASGCSCSLVCCYFSASLLSIPICTQVSITIRLYSITSSHPFQIFLKILCKPIPPFYNTLVLVKVKNHNMSSFHLI